MSTKNPRMMFTSLPVRDLKKSIEFFSALGFEFNQQFSNEHGACMVVTESACVMLVTEAFFKSLMKKEVCDTQKHIEALFAFNLQSREEVDAIVNKAIAGGGTMGHPSEDLGFMYSGAFIDLDGHHWGPFWMDPSQA